MASFLSRYCRRSMLMSKTITRPLMHNSFAPFSTTQDVPSMLRIGDTAPNFSAQTTSGDLDFHEYIVCTTELGVVEKYMPEFTKRNVKCIGLSCDPIEDHHGWINDIVETQGLSGKGLSYPIIADQDRSIAKLYSMLDDSNIANDGLPLTVRSVFVIGPDKQIKLMLIYPASTGRNFDEIIRVLDSLQLTAYHKVATPVNWKDGDDCVIVPSIKTEDAKDIFPKGFKEVKPYLRMTPQPNK